jgi:hypothetical protein
MITGDLHDASAPEYRSTAFATRRRDTSKLDVTVNRLEVDRSPGSSSFGTLSDERDRPRPPADRATNGRMIVCCVWLSIGMAVDAWAHRNIPSLETFFTPWHALFYSGFGAVAAQVGLATWRNRRAGYPWRRAAPDGYAEAVGGLAIFAAGGIGDAIWHELFGVEKDLAALISPTHLLLFTGVTLLVSSPLRSAWRADDQRPDRPAPTLGELAPTLLSVMLALTMFSFITQNLSPFIEPFAARSHAQLLDGSGDPRLVQIGRVLGLAGFLVQTVLLVGATLPLLRRWRLPFGSFAALLTLNVALQAAISELYWFMPVALLAGLATDLLAARLVRPDGPAGGVRAIGFALPALLWGAYVAALALGVGGGLAWEVELWAGAVLISAATGLLLSFLVVPIRR